MIVVDAQALQSESFGARGIGRYVADLLAALAAEQPDAFDVVAWNDRFSYPPALDALGDRVRSFSDLRGSDVDVLHVQAPFDSPTWAELAVPVRARRLVVTCFDLIPYRFPEVYLRGPAARARYITRLGILSAADAIVTDSRSAADDVIELVGVDPARVTVIGGGVGAQFRPPTAPLADRIAALRRSLPALSARFVLVPTGMDWRKNIEGAIRAFGRLPRPVREQHQLVLQCAVTEPQRGWMHDVAADAGVADRVLVTGRVADAVLVGLYQSAELVLVPSLYEGFGLPVLEARACGARVICSNASSLPEVLPEPRAWFDPRDLDDVAAAVERALTDATTAAMLERVPDPGLGWSRAAAALAGVYRRMRDEARAVVTARPAATRGRLGVVTVLPPTPSGIADHSARLLDALHGIDGIEIAAFVAGALGRPHEVPYPVLPLAALADRWVAGDLDGVVYCVGNNRLHRDLLALVPLVPGHVLLHDVFVGDAFEPPLLDVLAAREYPGRDRDEIMWSAPFTRAAISVMVQSAHAAELVLADSGVRAIDVGPHPCEQVATSEHLDDGGLPWVVSAGIAHEIKQSDVIAAAMAELSQAGVARCALVGARGELFKAAGDVAVTGHVDDAELDGWLRRATVLVQLRRSSQGESSGIVAHAMARGVPLVVSDLGAMAELPERAAVKVPVDITPGDLASTLAGLLADPDQLAAMREAGLAFAARETPLAQAHRIVDVVFGRAGERR